MTIPMQARRSTHALFTVVFAAVGCAAAAQAADLTVELDGYETGKGHLMVAAFATAQGFPDDSPQRARIEANGKTATAVFKSLAPGRYAVSAYADENDNGKLDRGLFGIPKERYGFSQDARGMSGPPEFRDAAFPLPEGGARVVVHLK